MYEASVSTAHRTAFVILIDASGSMQEKTMFQNRLITKAEAVSMITNALLFELVERARRFDGVRNYYDIAIWGYTGDDEVVSFLPGGADHLSIDQLANCDVPVVQEPCAIYLPSGITSMCGIPTRQWVQPRAIGHTPMCEAMRYARDFVREWCRKPENLDSFPPIVFNITDGMATDCTDSELIEVCRQVRSCRTADGNVLLLNIHLTANREMPYNIFCANEEEIKRCENRYAQLLYDCSSVMPDLFNQDIQELKDLTLRPPYRGLLYNASVTQLISMLNIGSISVRIG